MSKIFDLHRKTLVFFSVSLSFSCTLILMSIKLALYTCIILVKCISITSFMYTAYHIDASTHYLSNNIYWLLKKILKCNKNHKFFFKKTKDIAKYVSKV